MNDFINASFTLFSSLFILNNCRIVIQNKSATGVSKISTAFFCSWGLWNIFFYYPNLNQWFSFCTSLLVCSSNFFWLYLQFKYKKVNYEHTPKTKTRI